MDIPKFDETFIPILEVLKDGKVYKYRALIEAVKTKFYSELTEEQLKQETKSGDLLVDNRIGWGKTYLKKGGYIESPERGLVQITEKGKSHSPTLTVRDLESEASLFEFYKPEKQSNSDNTADKKTQIEAIDISSPQDLIDEGFSRIESDVKNELLKKLKNIDPYFFEKVVLRLLKKMGHGEFIETPKSNDGGIDGIINEDKLGLDIIYIQAKRWRPGNVVGRPELHKFVGALAGQGAKKGIFITTSNFTKEALEYTPKNETKIVLIDGEQLAKESIEYKIVIGNPKKTDRAVIDRANRQTSTKKPAAHFSTFGFARHTSRPFAKPKELKFSNRTDGHSENKYYI